MTLHTCKENPTQAVTVDIREVVAAMRFGATDVAYISFCPFCGADLNHLRIQQEFAEKFRAEQEAKPRTYPDGVGGFRSTASAAAGMDSHGARSATDAQQKTEDQIASDIAKAMEEGEAADQKPVATVRIPYTIPWPVDFSDANYAVIGLTLDDLRKLLKTALPAPAVEEGPPSPGCYRCELDELSRKSLLAHRQGCPKRTENR